MDLSGYFTALLHCVFYLVILIECVTHQYGLAFNYMLLKDGKTFQKKINV